MTSCEGGLGTPGKGEQCGVVATEGVQETVAGKETKGAAGPALKGRVPGAGVWTAPHAAMPRRSHVGKWSVVLNDNSGSTAGGPVRGSRGRRHRRNGEEEGSWRKAAVTSTRLGEGPDVAAGEVGGEAEENQGDKSVASTAMVW